MKTLPLAVEIPYDDPALLFRTFAEQAGSFFLDSADANQPREDTNRYSYIGFDPFEKIIVKERRLIATSQEITHPFSYLKKKIADFQLAQHPELPPFQGGAMGYFSYDLCHYLEEINPPKEMEALPYADLAIGLYDVIIAFDHLLQKAWVIATGFPETTKVTQLKRAEQRAAWCLAMLSEKNNTKPDHHAKYKAIQLASPFTKNAYIDLVKQAKDYILEGDIFEINLSQRFTATLEEPHDDYSLYLTIRAHNPAPFSAYLNLGDHRILSFSPERFLSVNNRQVSTRPIKGTAARGQSVTEDKSIATALLSNEKERAENIMIVDLLRNDLSKACLDDSIIVEKLCGLETYPSVHHLVSVITALLRPEMTALDLLAACFPGGSITGAPKVRAMQIIYELEPTRRGPYCGSIGYIGFSGAMDTSIVIRTVLLHTNILSYQTGGAVVLDSCPAAEYEETLTKSAVIKRILCGEQQ